jgi:DNA invertase Pin-like site-specific DNA recombinase
MTHPCASLRSSIRREGFDMKVAMYLRVSTDGQTTDNQRVELERVATARGWQVVKVFDDNGVSGAKGREYRKAFDELLKGATRREFDMVAAWSVDRLGRSLRDLIGFLDEIHGAGVDLYLHQQGLDTSTPAGRAMFGMLGIFAEFERAMIVERVRAGMTRARAQGKHLGRPPVSDFVRDAIMEKSKSGSSCRAIARELGIGDATVRRALRAQAA